METLLFKKKQYVPIFSAARMLNCKLSMMYYYVNNNMVKTIKVDNIRLVDVDSLMILNDYLQFRHTKNNLKEHDNKNQN